jgi:3-hydroxy-9,10-secoandrosta-1,3,5(10)-triene-9,17-dione monooxygenase
MTITTSQETRAGSDSVGPDLSLTPAQLIQRAIDLRPTLLSRQEEVEENTFYPESTHQQFLEAGFYRTMQPKRFGGYEFGVPTFYKIIMEIARGCPSTGWCLSLASAHSLQLAAFFGEQVQEEAFGSDGDFRMAGRDTPMGTATPVDGGYIIDGSWNYCSGIPYSTHVFLGAQITQPGESHTGEYSLSKGKQVLAVLPRSQWEINYDWVGGFGLRGSGSHGVTVSQQFVPDRYVVDVNMLDVTPEQTIGARIHDNPMYAGRQVGFFGGELASIAVGTARAALDEYERLIRTKKTTFTPHVIRAEHSDYQRTFGQAMGMIDAAEAIIIQLGNRYMELCQLQKDGVAEFTLEDDIRLDAMAIQAARLAWTATEDLLVRTSGSSPLGDGQRMQRYFRDFATYRGHQAGSTYETMARYLACIHLDQDFERL